MLLEALRMLLGFTLVVLGTMFIFDQKKMIARQMLIAVGVILSILGVTMVALSILSLLHSPHF